MENNIWIQDGNTFTKGSANTISHANGLPVGVYEVQKSMMGYYINKVADNFVFDYKLYGVSNSFIDYFIKTYNNTTGNLGILFNGIKGTGKTVTAKMLCNKLQLPVILIKNCDKVEEMLNYLATQITFECIFFFDEYEKEFEDSSEILSFMDGVYNSEKRKIFLLTTNTLKINENLLGRPSRIRYVKSFDNLSEEIVQEILNDIVIDKNGISTIQDIIQQMPIATIDLVKNLAQEVNIHGIENINTIKEVFNIELSTITYSVDRLSIYNYYWTTHPMNVTSYEEILRNFDLYSKARFKKDKTNQEENALNFRDHYFWEDAMMVVNNKKLCNFKLYDIFDCHPIIYISTNQHYLVTMDCDTIYIYKIKSAFMNSGIGNTYQII